MIVAVTCREYEVWSLIAQGQSLKMAADKLGLNHKTIEKHRTSLYPKIGAKCQADAARLAVEYGLIQVVDKSQLLVILKSRNTEVIAPIFRAPARVL